MTKNSLLEKEFWNQKEVVFYATEIRGFPLSIKTLQTLISRGGSPRYQKFGRRVLYKREHIDAWLDSRLSPIKTNSLDIGGSDE